jgi:hypothetical protein
LVGQLKLSAMVSVPEDRKPARYVEMLSAAAGYIYEAAGQGGFVVPFDLSQIPAGELRDATAAMLAAHCCCLAIWQILPIVIDAPEGLKKAKAEADAFLATLSKGQAILGGLARVAPAASQGRVAFAGSGESSQGLSSAWFDRVRTAWPSGPSGDLERNMRGGEF